MGGLVFRVKLRSQLDSQGSLFALPSCFVLASWPHWAIPPLQIPQAHSCLDCWFCLMLPAFLCCLRRMQFLTFKVGTSLRHLSQACIRSHCLPLCMSVVFCSSSAQSGRQMVSHLRDCGLLGSQWRPYLIYVSATAWPLVDVVELKWVTQFKPLMF